MEIEHIEVRDLICKGDQQQTRPRKMRNIDQLLSFVIEVEDVTQESNLETEIKILVTDGT